MIFFRSLILITTMAIGSVTSFACVCVSMGFTDSEAKAHYNVKTFEGAIFTGKIKSIRDLPEGEDWGDGIVVPLQELDIEIEQYWFGVGKSELTVSTLGPGTSCSVDWEKDRTLFFIASRNKRGLNIGSCDLSNWRGTYPNAEWADYTKRILGPAKSFPKRQTKPAISHLIMEYSPWNIVRSLRSNPVNSVSAICALLSTTSSKL